MHELIVPAIRVQQQGGRCVYTFAADGKAVSRFSAVSRLRSGGLEAVYGYQRPEVVSHIGEIRRYLEGDTAILPNSIVLAFDSSVEFTPSGDETSTLTPGHLRIQWDPDGEMTKRPGWVVDGQQRLAAIRDAKVESFNVCVTAFITDEGDLQREQFLLLNNTKPLPKSLIYELLPGTEGLLPEALSKKRFPALLTRHLNLKEASPFYERIRIATNPKGVIRDNSIMRMLEHSLSDGALFRIRLQEEDQDTARRRMLELLYLFWTAAAETWPTAWGLPPRRSRLLHGAGIVALGFLMDEMAEIHWEDGGLDLDTAKAELAELKDLCFWTSGIWPFGEGRERLWNELQNTSRDVNLLSNYLLRQYRIRVRGGFAGARKA